MNIYTPAPKHTHTKAKNRTNQIVIYMHILTAIANCLCSDTVSSTVNPTSMKKDNLEPSTHCASKY
jgi:hypothetical protein